MDTGRRLLVLAFSDDCQNSLNLLLRVSQNPTRTPIHGNTSMENTHKYQTGIMRYNWWAFIGKDSRSMEDLVVATYSFGFKIRKENLQHQYEMAFWTWTDSQHRRCRTTWTWTQAVYNHEYRLFVITDWCITTRDAQRWLLLLIGLAGYCSLVANQIKPKRSIAGRVRSHTRSHLWATRVQHQLLQFS